MNKQNLITAFIIIFFELVFSKNCYSYKSKISYDSNTVSYVGKVWLGEKQTWIDSEFGKEITKWSSDKYSNWHLYFNIESFIDEHNAIVYSDRAGKINLFKLNFNDGTFTQLTDHQNNVENSVWHYPHLNSIWYKIQNSIRVLNYKTMENEEVISDSTADFSSFTITCDGKYLLYSVNKNPGFSQNHSTGPYAIMRYEILTKTKKQISPDYGFRINHLQASPTNPSIITYAWQHQYRQGGEGTVGYIPIRIWWLNINEEIGGPVNPQEYGIHRTHEFWFYDGSRLGYSARYIFGSKKGMQFLGSCKEDGSDNFMFEAPIDAAHSQVYKDNKHWVTDFNNGMILTLWKFEREKVLNEEKLFRHDSSWQGQPSHPHPHFSPDGKKILFSTDKTGKPQIYTVKIDLNKN